MTSFTISSSSTLVKMAEGIKTPLKFDGLNFPTWKVKITVFLQSLESRVAKAVTKPFNVSIGDVDTWSDNVTKEFDENAKAHYILFICICRLRTIAMQTRSCDPTR